MIEYENLAKSNDVFMAELEAAASRVIRGGWYVLVLAPMESGPPVPIES